MCHRTYASAHDIKSELSMNFDENGKANVGNLQIFEDFFKMFDKTQCQNF